MYKSGNYILNEKTPKAEKKNSYVSAVAGGQKKSHPGGRDCFFLGFFPHWSGIPSLPPTDVSRRGKPPHRERVFDTFIWSYQRQRKNVLPIILCCQKEMDGDCVLRFPDISTSLFSHAGVSVNSAENKRGI